MRVATFNLQNLRLRGEGAAARLDGARDFDTEGPEGPALDLADRRLTAETLAAVDADVAALQEVFDEATLDHFHDRFLVAAGAAPWPHRVCLPGNDGRGLRVAAISRLPLLEVRSHAADTPRALGVAGLLPGEEDLPVFRRDCLELRAGPLTLFICHFKAPYPDEARAHAVRRAEAEAVRKVVEARFAHPERALWLILGDFNEPGRPDPEGAALAPFGGGFAVDLMALAAERWTYHVADLDIYARPDGMFASPALAAACPDAAPVILHAGMGRAAARYAGRRFDGVGEIRPHASDHAIVFADFTGL